MKRLFQNNPLHITTSVFLFWKGIVPLLIITLLAIELSQPHLRLPWTWTYVELLLSTGFGAPLFLMFTNGFIDNDTATIVFIVVIFTLIIAFLVFCVLFAINRSCSNAGSIGLFILCVLDLPTNFIVIDYLCEEWWSYLVFIVFNIAILISLVILRRSRQGARTWLNKMPDSI